MPPCNTSPNLASAHLAHHHTPRAQRLLHMTMTPARYVWPVRSHTPGSCLADTSRLLYPSGRVLELESETRLAIMLILTLGGHSGFRVTGTGQVHGGNEVQTL